MFGLRDYFKNKKKLLLILILTITLFSCIAYYYYTYIVQPKLNKKYIDNKEFISEDSKKPKNATLYLFYTSWCPHCKNAEPEWEALKNTINDSVKGVNIVFQKVDCEVETTLADKFKIEGYPTIKLVYNNKIYDYDAKPSKENLLQFLNDVL